jgi:hypothetical protein
LPEQTTVYFEIQDERMLEKISFLKYLSKEFKVLVKKIENFSISNIEYQIDNIKLSYVLEHLNCYDKNLLDSTDLPNIEKYKPTKLVEKHVELLTKYFSLPFSALAQPTYYEFNYWVNLFYESCCSFSGSYMISNKYFTTDYSPQLFQ